MPYVRYGTALNAAKKYTEAYDLLKTATVRYQFRPEVWKELGVSSWRLGRWKDAERLRLGRQLRSVIVMMETLMGLSYVYAGEHKNKRCYQYCRLPFSVAVS